MCLPPSSNSRRICTGPTFATVAPALRNRSSSHRVIAASPHLSCRCCLLRYIIVLSTSPVAPLCWLVVVFVPSPTRRRRLLRCVVSPHASRRRRLASPVPSLYCIVLICRVVAVSRVASCPSLAVLSLPSLALRYFVYLPPHFIGRLDSSVLPCRRSRICARLISIAMTHRRRDVKSI